MGTVKTTHDGHPNLDLKHWNLVSRDIKSGKI